SVEGVWRSETVEQIAALRLQRFALQLARCLRAHEDGLRQFRRHLLNTQDDGNGFPQQRVGAALCRTNRADKHGALFDADAESQRLKTLRGCGRQQGLDFLLHFLRGSYSLTSSFIGSGIPERDKAIAFEFMYPAMERFDDAGGLGEEEVEDRGAFFRQTRFTVGREVTQVRAQQRHRLAASLNGGAWH